MNNKIFFLIGPSGVGKSTVRKYIETQFPQVKYIPSYTTRHPRENEINGEDYFFISIQEFLQLKDSNLLIEWEEHFGNYYGISKDYCEANLKNHSLIKEIAIGGYKQIISNTILSKDYFHSIFIYPDKLENLIERLGKRNDVNNEERKNSIIKELGTSSECDHIVISETNNLPKLYLDVQNIITHLL